MKNKTLLAAIIAAGASERFSVTELVEFAEQICTACEDDPDNEISISALVSGIGKYGEVGIRNFD